MSEAKDTVLSLFDRMKAHIAEKSADAQMQREHKKQADNREKELELDAIEAGNLIQDQRYPRQQKFFKTFQMMLFKEQNSLIRQGDINGATYIAGQADLLETLMNRAERALKR